MIPDVNVSLLTSKIMIKLAGEINFYKYKRKIFEYCKLTRQYSTKDTFKVLFFGTDNFSLPSFKLLHSSSLRKSKVSALSVVTSFKSPANCIRTYAELNSIPAYKWPVNEETCSQYDLGVVVSFGHMIPENVIRAFPLGMINVHASILPRWRGAAPIIYSIMKGDTKTGVSIMKIEPKKFDVGDIYSQKEIVLNPHILMPELHKILANEGAELLISTLNAYPDSFNNPQKQNDSLATYAPRITSSVGKIDWKSMTASDIYNLYRALFGYKEMTTKFKNFNMKLVDIKIGPTLEPSSNCLGSIEYIRSAKCLRARCKNNTSIDILKVKIEGKRTMTALEFTNGFLRKYEKCSLVLI